MFQLRESAETAVDPHLLTIATLTGHAVLTVGPGYTVSTHFNKAEKTSSHISFLSSY